MIWERLPLGPLQTNCYIIKNERKECLIFDPGGDGDRLLKLLRSRQYTPLAILLTHAHFDHIGAVDVIREAYKIPLYIHKNEEKWLEDPSLNGSQFFMMGSLTKVKSADRILTDESSLTIGSFNLEVMRTPGHSPGSLSFYIKDNDIVIAGDTLFQGSIGRTDLPGGNHEELLNSIHTHLLSLPENTLVLPGHGHETSVEEEMDQNPFLNGF
ncbi:MBL fold metallo-hydrolase [Bacillus spongiae]|uniref:MBL fold metallo-hydrolase n=1 Tax=Bacillus spongiae TaxID=2683610 RepID=A0ABU8H9L9_9BACI